MNLAPILARWQARPYRVRVVIVGTTLAVLVLVFMLSMGDADVGRYPIRPGSLSDGTAGAGTDGTAGAAGEDGGGTAGWEFVVDRDGENYGLSEEQCQIAFPKLFYEVDKSAAARQKKKISWKEVDNTVIEDGMVRGLIHQGEVYTSCQLVEYSSTGLTMTVVYY